MAYDADKLRNKIKESGMKIEPLAKAVGLTREGFYKKLDRGTEWTPSQILVFCEILRLNENDRREMFLI